MNLCNSAQEIDNKGLVSKPVIKFEVAEIDVFLGQYSEKRRQVFQNLTRLCRKNGEKCLKFKRKKHE